MDNLFINIILDIEIAKASVLMYPRLISVLLSGG